MILGVHHVGLRAASARNVREALGAGLALDDVDLPGWVRGPNVFLHIASGSDIPLRPPHALGFAHLCVQSAAGKEAFARLEAEGVRFIAPLTGLGGPYLYAYGHLPGAALMELEATPCAPHGGPNAWFGHIAIVTRDLNELAAFYATLLQKPITKGGRLAGSVAAETITGLPGVDVRAAWIHGLNLGLEFWTYAHPPPPPRNPADTGLAVIAFETDALEEDIARALAHGAAPAGDIDGDITGIGADLIDPHGNRFRLIKPFPPEHCLSLSRLSHADVLGRFAASMDAAV
jgi:catechol 2,3-dioxygenase-like lactoylglutathione lyase family enzyme